MENPAGDLEQMKHELQMLQQQVDNLTSQPGHTGKGPTRSSVSSRARRIATHGLAVVGFVALIVVTLAAAAPQALTIDSNGVVHIGVLELDGTNVKEMLTRLDSTKFPAAGGTVTGDLTSGGTFTANERIVAANSDIYFTKTDHKHSGKGNTPLNAAIENVEDFHGLMILGRMETNNLRVVRFYDRVGIGGGPDDGPKAPLDVNGEIRGKMLNVDGEIRGKTLNVDGEIRGKIWSSGPYTVDWSAGIKNTLMTKTESSVCFLTSVRGKFLGKGEEVSIIKNGNQWALHVDQGAGGEDVKATAMCIGAPDK